MVTRHAARPPARRPRRPAVEQHPDVDPDLRLARLTVDMYRFPPMTPHQVTARVVRQGRRVGALDVRSPRWQRGGPCQRVLLLRPGPPPATTAWSAPEWDVPGPDELPALAAPDGGEPTPGEWEIRLANPGGFWSDERKQVWSRDNRPLVAGEPLTPLVRAALSADLPNPLANAGAEGLSFINADLTLFLARPPGSGLDRPRGRRPPRRRRSGDRHLHALRPRRPHRLVERVRGRQRGDGLQLLISRQTGGITVVRAGHGGPSRKASRRSCAARCPFGSRSSRSQRQAATIASTRPRQSLSTSWSAFG